MLDTVLKRLRRSSTTAQSPTHTSDSMIRNVALTKKTSSRCKWSELIIRIVLDMKKFSLNFF